MLTEPPLDPLAGSQPGLLTGLPTRPALLASLFRETDRVQRSREPLSLVLFEIDDVDHWRSQQTGTQRYRLLGEIVERIGTMLRSYDTFGRAGDHQFLLILPGCSTINANLLAERLRIEAFAVPATVGSDMTRLSACFGIASSEGRSPVVVLREAEMALKQAQESGPDSIWTFARSANAAIEPIAFLS